MSSTTKPKLVIDNDIVTDYFRLRHPFHEDAEAIISSVMDEKCEMLLSHKLWGEYQSGAWHKDTFIFRNSDEVSSFIDKVKDVAVYYANPPHQVSMEKNRKDEHTVNLAVHLEADFIVTRDKDVLKLAKNIDWNEWFPQIKVIHSRDFANELSLWQERQQQLEQKQDRGPSLSW